MNARSESDNELLAKVATDVAVLTARFDATLPYLATKADLLATKDEISGVRVDINGVRLEVSAVQLSVERSIAKVESSVNARLSKMQYWLIGTVVTCALGVGGMYATMMYQFISLSNAQQTQMRQEMQADREQLRQEMQADRQQLRQEMKAGREELRQEIAGLSNRIDRVLEANAAATARPPRR